VPCGLSFESARNPTCNPSAAGVKRSVTVCAALVARVSEFEAGEIKVKFVLLRRKLLTTSVAVPALLIVSETSVNWPGPTKPKSGAVGASSMTGPVIVFVPVEFVPVHLPTLPAEKIAAISLGFSARL